MAGLQIEWEPEGRQEHAGDSPVPTHGVTHPREEQEVQPTWPAGKGAYRGARALPVPILAGSAAQDTKGSWHIRTSQGNVYVSGEDGGPCLLSDVCGWPWVSRMERQWGSVV